MMGSMEPNVQWLSPSVCSPPHRITHPEKAAALCQDFLTNGWNTREPALVGYQLEDGIQLITGSHRWAAAMGAGIQIPVRVEPYGTVLWSWGNLERWFRLLGQGEVSNGQQSC